MEKADTDDWWPRWVWVGECFFWYRLTRVFPDKFHRAVKRLCVCVCPLSLTSRYFHSASATLSLTMLWYSSHLFLLELLYMNSWFAVLNHMYINNNLCFARHSSFGMTLTLETFASSSWHTIIQESLANAKVNAWQHCVSLSCLSKLQQCTCWK